jgi:probable rRNA maturation factor
MMPDIQIEWLMGSPECEEEQLSKILSEILSDHRTSANVTCIVTEDAHLQQLNREFRGKDLPTDVLSFELTDAVHPDSPILGDVYISIDQARLQAREATWPLAHEITKLAVHGVLHLLGYDHRTDTEHRQMRAQEDRYLTAAGVITEKGA